MSTPPRSVLTEGRRRGPRWSRIFAAAALLGTAIAGVVLAVAWAIGSGGEHGPSARRAAAGSPALLAGGKPNRPAPNGAPQAGGGPSRFAVSLSEPDVIRVTFHHKPKAGLLFGLKDGQVLWRLHPTRRLAIASLTKMMTALLVVEREDPHERVRITRRATRTSGSAVGVLPRGKHVQLEALLNGLLLVSGNDAAVALAQHSAGGVRRFVALMNRKAHQLRLSCTHFTTPHGLRDEGNHSCAADLATLARADLARGRIRRITARRRAILKFPIKGGRLFLYNNNTLMRAGYRGVTGLKTGYTDRAGRSIVATARRGRTELGVVLLHSYDPATQARKLLDRGFEALARERDRDG
jgi:serine-type D-Ala-D-Ala carboxypeptidase (penicillin-binding protein 5/6)